MGGSLGLGGDDEEEAHNHNREEPNPLQKPGNLKTMRKQQAEQIEVKKWLAIRKKAGCKIDPETAEVMWIYAYDLDPYGTDPELPDEYRQVGRNYYARSPGSDIC